jgi:hypothetical protein
MALFEENKFYSLIKHNFRTLRFIKNYTKRGEKRNWKNELQGLNIQYINARIPELTLMGRDLYIIPPEVISVAYFVNSSHQ